MNINFELTEEQANNLIAFLKRIDLKGSEAVKFVELYSSLQKQAIEYNKKIMQDD